MERILVHEVFAMILDGEIKNITVCDNYSDANYLAQQLYGSTAIAVDCTQYIVGVGDRYHDGLFWEVDPETGEERSIPAQPTEEQQVQRNKGNIQNNKEFAKESFKILSSLINTSSLKFSEDSPVVAMYGVEYTNANYDVTVIPNVGNLLSVILSIFGTAPTAE